MMNNNDSNLFKILDIPDDGTFNILQVDIVGDTKTVHIGRDPAPTFCPECGCRMHSRGIRKRTANHPVLQDTTKVFITAHQRRWRCTNCSTETNEQFSFLDRYSHTTNTTFYFVCEAMKDLTRTTASIARQFNMSDTAVHDIFTAHVDLPRLPLPEYLSVDEVFLDICDNDKYSLVLMDFSNGQIVDILHNRWETTAEDYFLKISLKERNKVKAIISDAYTSYMEYPQKYFPNSVSILDSFHVVKYIISLLNGYINTILKKYREKDIEELKKKNHDFNLDNKSIKDSREVILLRDYRWVLLKNKSEINYDTKMYYNRRLGMNIDTYRIENEFLKLDSNFTELRDLKEKYIEFNSSSYKDEKEVQEALEKLIKEYKTCNQSIFRKFATFLENNKDAIIRSFVTIEVSRKTKEESDAYYARLSQGPMEGFNRKPKDLKRNSRGFSNFNYTRNRILWATRENPQYLGIPKNKKQVHSYKGKKRGKYNKKK